jgi:hypothetical protein
MSVSAIYKVSLLCWRKTPSFGFYMITLVDQKGSRDPGHETRSYIILDNFSHLEGCLLQWYGDVRVNQHPCDPHSQPDINSGPAPPVDLYDASDFVSLASNCAAILGNLFHREKALEQIRSIHLAVS